MRETEDEPRTASPSLRRRCWLLTSAFVTVLLLTASGRLGDRPDVVRLSASSSPPATTSVIFVRPLDAEGRLITSFLVTKTVKHADCAQASEKVSAALRCSAGAFLYDPCWNEEGRAKPSVICMSDPWKRDVKRLLTASEVPPIPPDPGPFPAAWGVELENGQRCRVATGAHDSIGDDVVDYYCGEQPGLVLLRDIDQSAPLWQVRAARYGPNYRRVERVEPQTIRVAWY